MKFSNRAYYSALALLFTIAAIKEKTPLCILPMLIAAFLLWIAIDYGDLE